MAGERKDEEVEVVDQDELELNDDNSDEFEIEESSGTDEGDDGSEGEVRLSREQFSLLEQRSKTDEQIAAALEKLASANEPAKSQPVGDPFLVAINDTDELDDDSFEEQLFERGKSKQALKKFVDSYVNPKLTKLQAKTLSAELRAELAENNDVKPYADEVKQMLAQLPPEKRIQDGIVQAAIGAVRQRHEDEITQKRIEDAVNERLKQLGVSADKTSKEPKLDHTEGLGDQGGGSASGSTGASSKKRKIRMTSEQRSQAELRARQLGMTFSDYVNNVYGG